MKNVFCMPPLFRGVNHRILPMKQANRLEWVDQSRGLAFLMVIFSHMDFDNYVVMRFFNPVLLTTFFFVSGYLYKDNIPFLTMLRHRTRTLLWPFIVLGSILIFLSYLHSYNDKQIGLLESYGELFSQYGYVHINTMWFIPSLYLYSIGFYPLLHIKNNRIRLMVVILCMIINWFLLYIVNIPSLPWHIGWMGFAWFYMYLGKLYQKNESIIDKVMNPIWIVILLVLYIFYIVGTNRSCNFYGSPFLIDSLVLTHIGLTLMIYISKRIHNRFTMFIGGNTLLYFAFHGKCMSLVNQCFLHFNFVGNTFLEIETILLLGTILTAVLLIPICLFINRYMPFLIGKFK